MKPIAGSAGLACAALLAGCTVGPNYRAPDLAASTPTRFAESVTGPQPAPELNGWWHAYHDPELDRLIALALADSPDIGIAAARIAQARAAERVAGAAGLPTVDATAGTNYQYFSKNAGLSSLTSLFGGGGASGGSASGGSGGGIAAPGSDIQTYSLGFDASWELDLFGGARRQREGAAARSEAAVWNARDAQISLVAEVADAYLQMRALQRREVIARDEVARQQRYLAIADHTAQSGLVARGDFIRQRAQLASAVAAVEPIVAQGKAEMHALGALTGRSPDTLILELSQPRPTLAVPPAVPPGLPSELLRRRPDVRAAERNLAAATADVGVSVAELFPRLSLTAAPQLISTALSNLFSKDSIQLSGSAQATFPLLDFGRRRGEVAQRKAQADEVYFQYKKTVLGALREVEDALIRIRADDQRRQSLAAGLDDAAVSVRTVESRYAAGLTDFGDVLLARQALLSAQDGLATAEGDQRRDLVALYKALGGGWDGMPLRESEAGAAAAAYTRPK
jgi:NodT family efflux transporter outer membrane factor (OMF) lipoprotein